MIKLEIELPESCLNCPLHDGEYGRCNVDTNIPMNIYERPRSCPIIEEEKQDDVEKLSSIISLEDMKEIMNKSIKNAETWGDFYAGIIIDVYKLGLEHGKITSSRQLGNWIKNGKYNYTYKCSVCGETGPLEPIGEGVFKFNFCPNCGADMRGGQDETD